MNVHISNVILKDFFNQIKKTDYCWEWQGRKWKNGYGNFSCNLPIIKQMVKRSAHRFSYLIHKGPIPILFNKINRNKIDICHTCDNPSCVSPDHLFLGTPKINMQDASKKGRLIRVSPEERKRRIELRKQRREEWKKKMSADKKRYFQDLSPEEKLKYVIDRNLSMKGKSQSEQTKLKISKANKGHKCSDHTKSQVSKANLGNVPKNKGKKLFIENGKRFYK